MPLKRYYEEGMHKAKMKSWHESRSHKPVLPLHWVVSSKQEDTTLVA